MDSIQVGPAREGRLIVRIPYSPDRVAKIKTIPGRCWHPREKYWTVPAQEGIEERLRALFAGETIELDAGSHELEAPDTTLPGDPLLRRFCEVSRTRHLSPRTEEAYLGWIRRFLVQAGSRPEEMGEGNVSRFLSALAIEGRVSASTQNQALNALLFFFQQVLGKELGALAGIARAKRPLRLPVVLSREEVRNILSAMEAAPRLMATLLYGAGLRLMECCRLRVKDIDWSNNQIVVRAGKGDKDRTTMLPASAGDALRRQLEAVRRQHTEDLAQGLGRVELPAALDREYLNAAAEWGWQWVFPATSHYTDARSGQRRRHHLHESVLQRAFKEARIQAGVAKPAGCHALRHSFATHLIEDGYDIRTIQELLGHYVASSVMCCAGVVG